MSDFKSDVRDGMRIDWDVPITMDDGIVLRADVYRPLDDGRHPVILTCGPYGTWLHSRILTPTVAPMFEEPPDVPPESTNKYQNWEVAIREMGAAATRSSASTRWAPAARPAFSTVVVPRGPGSLPLREWAGGQALSNFQVGPTASRTTREPVAGGALQPRHLAALWCGRARPIITRFSTTAASSARSTCVFRRRASAFITGGGSRATARA